MDGSKIKPTYVLRLCVYQRNVVRLEIARQVPFIHATFATRGTKLRKVL